MNSRTRIRRMVAAFAAVTLGGLFALASGASASADEPLQVTLDPVETSSTYGEYWQLTAELKGITSGWSAPVNGEVLISSVDGVYSKVGFYSNTDGFTAYIGPSGDHPVLEVGEYDVSVAVRSEQYGLVYSGTSAPATLTITPAPITTEVRMIADPGSPGNAVITLSLGGEYVSGLIPGLPQADNPSVAALPAGTWHVIVRDSSGTAVFETSIEQQAGGRPSTTVYWTGDASSQYSADGSFTPVADSVDNFEITAATPFSYTSAAEQRPQPVPTVPGQEPAALLISTAPSVPLWSVAAAGLIAAGLAVAIIVLLVRLRGARHDAVKGDSNAVSA